MSETAVSEAAVFETAVFETAVSETAVSETWSGGWSADPAEGLIPALRQALAERGVVDPLVSQVQASVGAGRGESQVDQRRAGMLVGVPGEANLFQRMVAADHSMAAVRAVPRFTLGAELRAFAEQSLRPGGRGQELPDLVDRKGHHPTHLDDGGALCAFCGNLAGFRCCCHRDLDPFRPDGSDG